LFMSAVLVLFFVTRVFDPTVVLPAIVLGAMARQWWQVPLAALLSITLYELSVSAFYGHPQVGPLSLPAGFAASLPWSAFAYVVKVKIQKTRVETRDPA
jgi:hypothetical protein